MDSPKPANNASHVCARRRNQWHSDCEMNKLNILNSMGFIISWKLISIGLYGYDEIPALITYDDVLEYLDGLLTDVDEQTDKIISLICEKDNVRRFDKYLKELAYTDATNLDIQKRKWRAYLLKELTENINQDYLQGLLELMEFWISMGKPDHCPQSFPSEYNEKMVQDYFSEESYAFFINKNREWLNEEILSIINSED